MVPLDHVLALALLLAPADCESSFSAPEHACLWRTAQQTALSLELLDPRELPYVLSRPGDYEADLRLVRRRRADLRGAPPLADAWRFPPPEFASAHLAHNRAVHRAFAARREAMGALPGYDEALAEAERLYQVWDAVRDCRSEWYYVIVRRQALARLYELLGADDYHKARLPPPAPPMFPD
jgi:hypothetical protein